MKTLFRNLFSVLRRFKMATLLNILGLSVAFTAVIIIMMQVRFDLGFDNNHSEADHIYRIDAVYEGRQIALLPLPFIEGFRNFSPYVKAVANGDVFGAQTLHSFYGVEKDGNINYYPEKAIRVSGDFINVFQFDMIEGLASEINNPQTVLIPESTAKKMFGSESAIHKYLIKEDKKWVIGGVYKDFPENSSTNNFIYYKIPADAYANWNNFVYTGYVLMDPSASIDEQLDAYVKTIDPGVFYTDLSKATYKATPLKQIHFDTHIEFDYVEKVSRQTIWILIGIALVILLIAVINFTNYSIALTPLRIKSINTQKVLGATEKRLRGSLILEAIILCLLSWGVSLFFVHLLSLTSIAQVVSPDMALNLHWGLLFGVALLAIAVGVFAGIYPAFYSTSFAPALVLKGSFGLSPKGRQLRNSLVGIQFVASFALIVVSLFMYLQIQFMQKSSLGFDKEQILITEVNEQILQSRATFTNEIKTNPNIEAISYAESLLSSGDIYPTIAGNFKGEEKLFQMLPVDTGFLRTMGIELLEGRDLTLADTYNNKMVFIFNEKAREELGLSLGDKTVDGEEVIGFVPNFSVTSMRKEVEPMAFTYVNRSYCSGIHWAYIRVKAGSDIKNTMRHVETTLEKLSPGFPTNVNIYDSILNNVYIKEHNLTSLITWFSLIAVLISIVGVFGLVVFESEYKRKEIGVRKVLGSTTVQILAMFNIRYIRILAICFILAAPIAWYAVSHWLENFAYRTPIYWWVFLLSFLLITALTMATVTFQSWRVADANPVDSIKTE